MQTFCPFHPATPMREKPSASRSIGMFARLAIFALVYVFPLITASGQGLADETSEVANGITIEEAVLEPAKKGERARLRFKITNFSSRDITLQGARATIAKNAEIEMKLGEAGYNSVKSVPILREETLSLVSSHIKIELIDLVEDVKPGSEIEFALVFSDFEVTAIADVH